MKIFKYEIPIQGSFEIKMPSLSKILSFQVQKNRPVLWVMVDEKNDDRTRYFTIVGTGHEFEYHPDVTNYIGTIQAEGGMLVWHLFEDLI